MRLAVRLLVVLVMPAASAQELPEGPGRAQVVMRCAICHETDLIAQQRLSRAGWGREIDKMIRWGAVVESGEREAMLDYLAANFAPKLATVVAADSPSAAHPGATPFAADETYTRACLVCHGDDLIAAQRLTRAGWMREVEKMMRWGAAVPESGKAPLIDYLAVRFSVR